jgi:predicted dehydrogenase
VTRQVHPAFHSGAEDYACAILEFENGVIGELFGAYSGFRQPWGEMFMIFGDDGAVNAVPPVGTYTGPAWVATRARTSTLATWWDMFKDFTLVEPDRTGLPSNDAFVNEILHFAGCCASGATPLSSGRDNLGTIALVFAIYESARRGMPLRVAGGCKQELSGQAALRR